MAKVILSKLSPTTSHTPTHTFILRIPPAHRNPQRPLPLRRSSGGLHAPSDCGLQGCRARALARRRQARSVRCRRRRGRGVRRREVPRGFFETFSDKHKTKLSSAGLVYKHFGKEIIASELDLKQEDKDVDTLYVKVYDDFIEALDGTDNGINQYPLELTPAYKDSTNLHSRVGRLNPWWNQKVTDTERDSRFQEVTLLAGNELTSRIRFLGLSWLPARSIVSSAFDTSDLLSRVVVLEQPCPWSEHLLDVERERGITEERNILYVLYPDDSNDSWKIQCVGKKAGGFDNRKSLPESWRGLRDDELSEISKIPGCVFVHAGG
ncbi:hypothetical protein BC936DRAFT_145083 [Jimgerdemannia flammicorona]|uniref:Uncharacterized protein n=1 Tax=Jimgerdemannia flammicorona TaxID=994334 RepID=A0A433DAZ4_9FUNG|nr:hypothetical protein BC936DRAFT_145083 [Jimgerdemannia flammicorona]